ncbi:hypothetical protein [Marinovum sp.]|uniref:hypothetical protein n=1 Tax=Marinovum sp. TaxID=2024839 RepID=UPI002B26A830|nr:hypothetical protein [Marinovum sp.]
MSRRSLSLRAPKARALFVLVCYVGLIVGGAIFGQWIGAALDLDLWPHTEPAVHRTIIVALIAYTVLMALPFVPGIEIGLALIAIFGARVVPMIYLSTVLALLAAFAVGRLVPASALAAGLRTVHLIRAARHVEETAELALPQRRARIETALPRWARRWLLKVPILPMLVLFNLPGNTLAGGGGGIAMALGASQMISWPAYALGVAIAVSPVPIAVLLGASLN